MKVWRYVALAVIMITELMLIELLQYARHNTKNSIGIISFKPHKNLKITEDKLYVGFELSAL